MKTRKVGLLIVSLMILTIVAGAAACGDGEEATATTAAPTETTAAPTETTAAPTETTAAATGEPIRIGGISSLTGPGASTGEQNVNGLKLAVEELNAAGGINGRPLEAFVGDAAGEPATAATAVNKLIQQDKVVAVVGAQSAQLRDACAQVCTEAKIPLVTVSTPMLETEGQVDEWVFLTAPGPTPLADAYWKMIQAEGFNSIFLASDQIPVFLEVMQLVADSTEEAGITSYLMPDTWSYTLTDYTPVVQKIFAGVEDRNPDLVVVMGLVTDTVPIVKGLRALGVTATIAISPVAAIPGALFAGGTEPMEGLLLPNPGVLNPGELPDDYPGKELLTNFAAAYEAKYGETANLNAGIFYDAVRMVAEAMKTAGDDPAKIRDALEKIQNFVTTQGVFNYSPTDHDGIHGGYAQWKVVNGEFTFVRALN